MRRTRMLICCNAGSRVGFGHFRRCQSLAYALNEERVEIHWLLETDLPAILSEAAVLGSVGILPNFTHPDQQAVQVESISTNYDALVLDHYGLTEFADQNFSIPWMRFDQGGSTLPTSASWIHNSLPGISASDYEGRLSHRDARLLLGPQFAILAPGFAKARAVLPGDLVRGGGIDNVLFTFGGGDDHGLNVIALKTVRSLLPGAKITILSTSANGSLPQLHERVLFDANLTLLVDSQNIPEVMKNCDLAISAGGTTMNELACLGVPSLVVTIAPNQERPAILWEKAGAVTIVSSGAAAFHEGLQRGLAGIIGKPEKLMQMATAGKGLVDGLGAARTAQEIVNTLR